MLIAPKFETLLHLEIEKRLMEQGCEVGAIGGMSDHVHMLFAQNPVLSLHETIVYVQGMTQRWYQLRDVQTGYFKFRWEEGYCAYSVSPSLILKTTDFIQNQKSMHIEMSLADEIAHFNKIYEIEVDDVLIKNESNR